MRQLLFTAIVSQLLWIHSANALPNTAFSGARLESTFIIAGGGQLPPGFDATAGGPTLGNSVASFLGAPDAVPFEDSQTIVAGLSPENPSVFFRTSNSTRNLGSEGAAAMNNHRLYQILEYDNDNDGTSDVSARGVLGESSSQASLSSELHPASANADVQNQRTFTFTNKRQSEFTFGIQGIFAVDMFAFAGGLDTSAEAIATSDLFFSSSNPLDIQFADTAPYEFDESTSGANAFTTVSRETDVAGTGHLSLTGMTSVSNLAALDSDAFASAMMGFALGITLQPGEVINMVHSVSYSTSAEIGRASTQVPAPGSLVLFITLLFGLSVTNRWLNLKGAV
jgi:hypothetical protein